MNAPHGERPRTLLLHVVQFCLDLILDPPLQASLERNIIHNGRWAMDHGCRIHLWQTRIRENISCLGLLIDKVVQPCIFWLPYSDDASVFVDAWCHFSELQSAQSLLLF